MNFPPRELAEQNYTVDPWQDDFGQQWVYTIYEDDVLKNRWNAVPSATSGGGTSGGGGGLVVSLAAPPDPYPGMQWFRLVDGVTYVRDQNNRAWMADTSAPIPALDDLWAELDTKLSAMVKVIEITATGNTDLSTTHANAYLYFTGSGAKTYTIPNGEANPVGTTATINNLVGTLTITHGVAITLIYPPDVEWDELDPFEMAQLVKVAENTWHLL
jgi:hypothetical protein